MVRLWDAGTERNEPPGLGPNQGPRQSGPDTGPAEGRISLRADGTRALPLASALAHITITESNGTYHFELRNISDMSPFATPIAPVIHALHGEGFHLFEPGMSASMGLERLAEDDNPSVLASEIESIVDDVSIAGTGPTLPGASVSFQVTPTQAASRLSIAAMVGQSNDAFIGTLPGGVALLDSDGMPRAVAEVETDLTRVLRVWDAGSEANEVPEIGPNQAPRQPMPNTGVADPDNHVRVSVIHASLRALRTVRSRTFTPSILLRFASDGAAFSPARRAARTPRRRVTRKRARHSPITRASTSRQVSGAGGSTQSQSLGGARASGSGGSGSTPTAQVGIGSPVTSYATVSA